MVDGSQLDKSKWYEMLPYCTLEAIKPLFGRFATNKDMMRTEKVWKYDRVKATKIKLYKREEGNLKKEVVSFYRIWIACLSPLHATRIFLTDSEDNEVTKPPIKNKPSRRTIDTKSLLRRKQFTCA